MAVGPFDNIRLLIIDDEDHFRRTLFKRLEKRGVAAHQAHSGEEGLAVMKAEPMDVVLLDVKMPGLGGIETLKEIKASWPQTEVIFLTGHSTTQDGVEGIKSGAFDYLSKPIEFEHLLEKIKQAYEKKNRDEERRQEAAYKARIEQQMIATERLASLGTLAAGVAHEINNPLAIINEASGYLKLLLGKEELSGMPRREDFEKAVQKISNGVKRARAITHQLLGTVRKHEPVIAEVDLKELSEETLQLVRKEAANKEIRIELSTGEPLPPTWLDPNQVRQILINLLTNAIHATGTGGKISVRIENDQEKTTLVIDDTGKGIPKENMEKIFEPFFSDKPPGEGTGLGLFVTRQIIDKLGGSIEVQSKVGVGTKVRVLLPRRAPLAEE